MAGCNPLLRNPLTSTRQSRQSRQHTLPDAPLAEKESEVPPACVPSLRHPTGTGYVVTSCFRRRVAWRGRPAPGSPRRRPRGRPAGSGPRSCSRTGFSTYTRAWSACIRVRTETLPGGPGASGSVRFPVPPSYAGGVASAGLGPPEACAGGRTDRSEPARRWGGRGGGDGEGTSPGATGARAPFRVTTSRGPRQRQGEKGQRPQRRGVECLTRVSAWIRLGRVEAE